MSLRDTFCNLIAFTVNNKYGKGGVVQITAVFDPLDHVACQRVF